MDLFMLGLAKVISLRDIETMLVGGAGCTIANLAVIAPVEEQITWVLGFAIAIASLVRIIIGCVKEAKKQ